MEPEAIVERLWPGRGARVEPLGGGITNHNFKVSLDGETFVLRIGGKDTELLGIDRAAEAAAARTAAALGLGPEVVAFVEPEGYLVTRYVAGTVGAADPRRVGRALRRLHDGPALPSRFDSFRVVEIYCAVATEHGVAVPAEYGRAHETARAIERYRAGAAARPCRRSRRPRSSRCS